MGRILTKEQWVRKKRRKRRLRMYLAFVLLIPIILLSGLLITDKVMQQYGSNTEGKETLPETFLKKPIEINYLTPNPYSRPQAELKRINSVVVHYTANPGTSAKANRSYFEGLAEKKSTYASSHFIIGLEGEIIQCIPLNEIAYASNERNEDTVAIECCHPDETGKFTEETYKSLVSLLATLCMEYDMGEKDIIRHYDVTGKLCPLYYVEHEDEWKNLRKDVINDIKKYKKAEKGAKSK
ncbi:N-acetylmuramoyl-L-alanine amidase [Lachnospiraceae bacterium MD1]|jgi:N-acetylmuramoyl-L-alanine amidase CwlA|uniref:N-acetylmuramoyl-L-alanine amidase n=1 Tax=Variimorphobacter saccharofermentans TaxID=2755051 RepID=A0A839K2H5_9FIRM|nr:peptidoglycan recognition family protein [Variimorphobacter saccharofermentans]MBB2184014.1 N-acetylmuramoyl-L-alanine amidase [Variimorphobacter saccharofermentans]